MGSISAITKRLKPWMSSDHRVRYYVNDWESIVGIKVIHDGRNNISYVTYKGSPMNVSHYVNNVRSTKVWFDETGRIHVDHCNDDAVYRNILSSVDSYYSEPEANPMGKAMIDMQERILSYLWSRAGEDKEASNIVDELYARAGCSFPVDPDDF